ncbi:MAG: FkbM family methyltransferase [Actinomycetota bacterium]|nr:FkbM family methyltransferase [Actinomycetota bacterium]
MRRIRSLLGGARRKVRGLQAERRERTHERRLLTEMRETFSLVYGREATDEEIVNLRERLGPTPDIDRVRLVRAAANLLDHQHHPTAFAVRFRGDDVHYLAVGGFELALDALDTSVSHPLAAGHYEPHLRPFFAQVFEPGMTFVDVGANVGYYAMAAAQAVGPEGRVHAFEPNSENCRLILLSAERNGLSNVSVHPIALGDETGHALFHTHLGSNGGLLDTDGDALLSNTTTVVPLARLDDIVRERVDVVKIDVEGAEGLVVRGAVDLLETHRPIVITEFSLDMLERVSQTTGLDYIRFWTERGYTPHLCERHTGDLAEIGDPTAFIDGFENRYQIEDLVMLP